MPRALIAALLAAAACGPAPSPEPPVSQAATPVEVVVLGTLGRAHLASRDYSLAVLKDIVRAIDPDVIAVELPADRLERALAELGDGGAVTEARVARFPEYTGAVFPMLAELECRLVGYDTWSPERERARTAAEQTLRAERPEEAAAIDQAIVGAEAALEAEGLAGDPSAIHSDRYDAITAAGMAAYDELWGEALGEGGWGAGNRARLEQIGVALEQLRPGERRVLVMTGAWRKGALRAGLSERDGVVVLELSALWPRSVGEAVSDLAGDRLAPLLAR